MEILEVVWAVRLVKMWVRDREKTTFKKYSQNAFEYCAKDDQNNNYKDDFRLFPDPSFQIEFFIKTKRVPFWFSSQFTGPSLKFSSSSFWSVNFHLGHTQTHTDDWHFTSLTLPSFPGIQLPEFHQQQGPLMMYSSFVHSVSTAAGNASHLRINHPIIICLWG